MNRRIVTWLAIFGIAFNALWPLLANAAPVDIQATICTTNKASQAAQQSPAKQIPASSSLPHCPFCLGVSDHTPGLVQAPAAGFERIISTFAAVLAGTSGGTSFSHLSAAPRGPPAPDLK
ncbi:MAG: hypothetical protein K8S22_00730 [Betaproteobacteria bacterium]|nr:hypothetical protein [Betaproteobacteria bacterium]